MTDFLIAALTYIAVIVVAFVLGTLASCPGWIAGCQDAAPADGPMISSEGDRTGVLDALEVEIKRRVATKSEEIGLEAHVDGIRPAILFTLHVPADSKCQDVLAWMDEGVVKEAGLNAEPYDC
jgi:hypothetical protein